MDAHYNGIFQGWEIAIAKKKIYEFTVSQKWFRRDKFEDLLQECLLHWYTVKESYDPSLGASQKTFMAKIISNKLNDEIRERKTDKRRINYLAVSFDDPIGEDKESPTLMDQIEDGVTQIADPNSGESDRINLKIDIAIALEQLTNGQREICLMVLNEGLTVQDVSQRLKIPRSTVYDDLKRIKHIFQKQGLKDYLA